MDNTVIEKPPVKGPVTIIQLHGVYSRQYRTKYFLSKDDATNWMECNSWLSPTYQGVLEGIFVPSDSDGDRYFAMNEVTQQMTSFDKESLKKSAFSKMTYLERLAFEE